MSNSFSFVGRIGKDAVTRNAGNTTATAFSLANNVGFGDKQTVLWVNCTVWGDRGSKSAQYIKKGGQLWVCGELSQREYDGKQYLEMRVSEFEYIGKREELSAPPQSQHHEQKSNGYAPSTNAPHDNFNDPYGDVDF